MVNGAEYYPPAGTRWKTRTAELPPIAGRGGDAPTVRVADAELVEVELVERGVVVELPHPLPVLVHGLLVEPDRRLVLCGDEWLILRVLGLDVPEVVPGLLHERGLRQQVDHGHRQHLRARGHALVRDGRGHRDRVR